MSDGMKSVREVIALLFFFLLFLNGTQYLSEDRPPTVLPPFPLAFLAVVSVPLSCLLCGGSALAAWCRAQLWGG